MYESIIYEVQEPAALITLNRPDSMNAWTPQMDREIRDAMSRAEQDRAVVAIVVTGAGRAFCAGADMNNLKSLASGAPLEAGSTGEPMSGDLRGPGGDFPGGDFAGGDFDGRFPYLMALDKPIIAAVNGPVAGMAYPFALCCDLRVVTPNALFVTSFAERGLIAEWGLSWLLPRLVGPSVALDLLFSSRRVDGEEAFRLGLANYLVDAEDLLSFCGNYVTHLSQSCSPTSIAVMKRQVYEQLHAGLGRAESEAMHLMVESFGRPDFAEGVKSFIEKRSPNFGRLPVPD